MKRTVLAFAALLAATGFAMAHEAHVKEPRQPAAHRQVIYDRQLDCRRDWSNRYDDDWWDGYYEECVPTQAKPLLGIDIDPFWLLQDLHP